MKKTLATMRVKADALTQNPLSRLVAILSIAALSPGKSFAAPVPTVSGTGISQLDSMFNQILKIAGSSAVHALLFLGLVAVAIVLIVNKDNESAKKKGFAWLIGVGIIAAADTVVTMFFGS